MIYQSWKSKLEKSSWPEQHSDSHAGLTKPLLITIAVSSQVGTVRWQNPFWLHEGLSRQLYATNEKKQCFDSMPLSSSRQYELTLEKAWNIEWNSTRKIQFTWVRMELCTSCGWTELGRSSWSQAFTLSISESSLEIYMKRNFSW